MPGYIPTALQKFQHKSPACPQDAPHPFNKIVYVKHIQLVTQKHSSPKPNSADTNRVQSISGTLYTMLVQLTQPCSHSSTKSPPANLHLPMKKM